jgi:hypothetical protein
MIHTETVHPSQLRRAMASYANQGYPPAYGPHPYQEGMMVVIITLPDDADVPDWRYAPPPRRVHRSWRIDGRQVLAWLCVLVIVGGLGYMGYTMATGGTLPTWEGIAANMPAMPEPIAQMFQPPPQRGEPVVERSGWHWPWESSVISRPAPRDDGFRWPWDDAAKQVSDTVDMVKNVTLFVVVLLLLGVALWFVAKVKGVFK